MEYDNYCTKLYKSMIMCYRNKVSKIPEIRHVLQTDALVSGPPCQTNASVCFNLQTNSLH